MTTKIIRSGNGSPRVFSGHTGLSEVVPFNPKPLQVYDLRSDDLPVSGADEEFAIDDYIDQQDAATKAKVAAAGAWVADTVYKGPATLASLRLRAGLSQKGLAQKCGLEQPHVSRYESGRHEPGVFQAQQMAVALGVTLDQLVSALHEAAENAKK